MDGILFEEWVREIHQQFTKERQNIDFCPLSITWNLSSHLAIENLVSIELIFLPLNTTSKLQPMDQGLVWSFKALYRALSVRKLIDAIEKERLLPEFSVLDALEVFDHAWGEVKDETIVNCFAKAGVSKEKQTDALLVAYDPSRISRTS